MLDERHTTTVIDIGRAGDANGDLGDAMITSQVDAVLGCWVGDCAPVVLIGQRRQLAVVHAGWRGLANGIIDLAIARMNEPVEAAVLGPAIGVCCYEFGEDDAGRVAQGVHAQRSDIVGTTTDGRSGLSVATAVARACQHHQIPLVQIAGCTGCEFDGFSHRARAQRQRHVVAAWQTAAGR